MPAIHKTFKTEKQYIEEERKAFEKSEYYKGEVFAMAGASKEHNKITVSLTTTIGNHLDANRYSYFPSDIRVHNPENTLFTYPDAVVVCGKEEYLDDTFDTLLNPTIIFEVLSPSTQDYVRGTKFLLYRSIESLQNYVIVSSAEAYIEVYTRNNEQWILTTAKGREGKILISAIDFELSLAEVYKQINTF